MSVDAVWPYHLESDPQDFHFGKPANFQFVHWMVESNRLGFGEYKLKSGRLSPYFLNLGGLNRGEDLTRLVGFYAEVIHKLILDSKIGGGVVIFGPAYKGIPLATAIAMRLSLLGITAQYSSFRKETKTHGDVGDWLGYIPKEGDCVIVVDDVITTGATKVEAVERIKATKAQVIACVIAFDRMETDDSGLGAAESFTKITKVPVHSVANLLALAKYCGPGDSLNSLAEYTREYGSRQARRAFKIPSDDCDNPIIIALDGMALDEANDLIAQLKDHVWGFKMNDLFLHGGISTLTTRHHDTRWFIDLKLHDIPNTVNNQIARLRDRKTIRMNLLTVHASGGFAMIEKAVEAAGDDASILAVTVLTSLGDLDVKDIFNEETVDLVCKLANMAVLAGAHGIVCSPKELPYLKHLDCAKIVPGVRPDWHGTPDDQKRVGTPRAIRQAGGTKMVIGRPITQADNPVDAAKLILEEWNDVKNAENKTA